LDTAARDKKRTSAAVVVVVVLFLAQITLLSIELFNRIWLLLRLARLRYPPEESFVGLLGCGVFLSLVPQRSLQRARGE